MTHTLWIVTTLVLCCVMAICADSAPADEDEYNYEESQVPQYTLPDPLISADGTKVSTAKEWQEKRRPELLELFRTQVYGQRPPKPKGITFDTTQTEPAYLHGKATRRDVRVLLPSDDGPLELLSFTLFTPKSQKPVPAFVGIHLFDTKSDAPMPGNALDQDVGIPLPGKDLLATILARGYAIATLDPEKFCDDDKETYRKGLLNYFYPGSVGPPGPSEPGALAVWAWGLSRALDYMEQDPEIDAKRVAVIGHSRRGKTALWAGAEDERFAIVISNDSGCGGAALSRRQFGETVERINRVFPHWFCGNFKKYNNREAELPVDQHELISLSAPRPVYVASAAEDRWADPRGEFLATLAAQPVYQLFGLTGLGITEPPPLNHSVGDAMGYHIRSGKHALTDYDWLLYLDFADRHFKSK